MSLQQSVRFRIRIIVILFLLGLGGLSIVGLYADRAMLIAEKRDTVRHLVEAAHGVAAHYASLERNGQLSPEQARLAAREAIRAMRYANGEYFWINDLDTPLPRMVMHPTLPELEGQRLDDPALGLAHSRQLGEHGSELRLRQPTPLFAAFNDVVREAGHGYVTYEWPKPLAAGGATETTYPKLSYVRLFAPWDWVIGSGIYIDDVDTLVRRQLVGRGGLALAFAIPLWLTASLLAASITGPLSRGARALEAMRDGRRELAPLAIERRDEVGTLIDGFNDLQQALREKTEALARSNAELEQLATVFTHAREGVLITAPDGTILNANHAFTTISGYDRDELIGNTPRILKSGRQPPSFYADMWRILGETGHWSGEIWNRHKSGRLYAELLTISAVRDGNGETRHYVALTSDITTRKEYQQRLEFIAHYDALTGLPNRVLLADRLRQAIAQAARRRHIVAVAYIDLDGFKNINDNHGHAAGDQLLVIVAERMQQCLREPDTIARLGGDEFVAVLADLSGPRDAMPVAQRLLDAASRPVDYNGLPLHVSSSIGIVCHDPARDDECDADQLLRRADQAMYQAKLTGKNRYHFFDAEHDRAVRGHHRTLERIRRALTDHEFELHFQPKVHLRSGVLVGVEALIRWRHPDRGVLPPSDFLPEVESTTLGLCIGEWVIDTALTQLEQWQSQGLEVPVISVNIAALHLQQSDFVPRLRTLLAIHPAITPERLELEVLETSALDDITHASEVIAACATLGVRFALDDFGTGYASLTYLKRLPVDLLKIDQSFVRDMLDDPDDMAIIDGVLGLAASFGREVIAEGVETEAHGDALLQRGCELAQGYGIARPMPGSALAQWVATWQPAPSWREVSATAAAPSLPPSR